MHTFFINNLIQLYPLPTCFVQPSVHLQEDLYMQLYGIISYINTNCLIDLRLCLIHVEEYIMN